MKKTLVVCSGGLDSVTLAHHIAHEQSLLALLTFDYGQRHRKEIGYAAACAKRLSVPHHVVDIAPIGQALTSSLTGDSDVPEGHYTAENMASTVVPNRNVIMLSIAFGLASSMGAEAVAIAVHGGDHFIYPDCRPDFIEAFARMQQLALAGVSDIALMAPFLHQSKADIARLGVTLQVPFEETWSCYQGDAVHCGRCGTCVERLEALHLAEARDTTPYADTQFWRQTVAEHAACI
ncbi:MAG TPA: 7-cyano-7-deazaguanine synthase QueC [Gammaproteobacteria bacterium]|jgi:7-cyano-7-deazaguanine synthase|nr:7-cyano-7-deazaguanine synthase QueC [Gammaproteobacteria bacterium]